MCSQSVSNKIVGPSGVGKTSFSSLFRNRHGNSFPEEHIPTDGMRIRNRIYYQDFKLYIYNHVTTT